MTELKKIRRVMLDLETAGKRAGCGVLCIGACTFADGLPMEKFYQRIDPTSSRIHLTEDIDTMRWWSKQDFQLKEEAFGGTRELTSVLDEFHDWFRSLSPDYKDIEIWGNGAAFDLPILGGAYAAVDRPEPWASYMDRCYRTLKNLLPHVKAPPRASKKHHALDDAIFQAEHATLLLQVL
jgi:hypothetical protein